MARRFRIVRLTLLFILLIHCEPALMASPQTQTQDDHNDTGPVQTGYAVVTPSFGAPGVTVMETVGLRQSGQATQTTITPPQLIQSGIMFVNESVLLSKDIGIAVVNPNSSLASITFTVRKNDGTTLQTRTIQVPTRSQTVEFLTQIFANGSVLPTEFTGSVEIDSTAPVSVAGLRFRNGNYSAIPFVPLTSLTSTLPVIATNVGGSGASLLPLFVAGGGWATEIVIANTNSSSVTVRLDLFTETGSSLTTALNGQNFSSVTNLTIPAKGILVYAPRDRNGDDDF